MNVRYPCGILQKRATDILLGFKQNCDNLWKQVLYVSFNQHVGKPIKGTTDILIQYDLQYQWQPVMMFYCTHSRGILRHEGLSHDIPSA